MKKVEMMVSGKLALVDEDMVAKMTKKQNLVAMALHYQTQLKKLQSQADLAPLAIAEYTKRLNETMSKIIRLNRTIRQTVVFVKG